tara:strand:+ start:217 stop:423 length:207 start_codon:yes stop_codon:yes gene_type:complete
MSKTVIFILFMVASIVIFDFYIIAAEGVQESISAYIIRWSHEYPSIPFLVGFVMGHLMWRMTDARVGK